MLKMQIFNFSFTLAFSLLFLLCPSAHFIHFMFNQKCSENRQTLPVERLVEAAAAAAADALQQKNRLPANNHFSPLVEKNFSFCPVFEYIFPQAAVYPNTL